MVHTLLWAAAFIVSLVALVKGADWFTKGAEDVGYKLGISPFIIGVTIVSIGTSLPEFASSLAAIYQGSSEIVMADVVGSNITNLLLGFGLIAIFCKGLKMKRPKEDTAILFAATFFVFLMSLSGYFRITGAIVSLVLFSAYMYYLIVNRKKTEKGITPRKWTWAYLIFGGVLVVASAHYLIISVKELSLLFGVSTSVIAASVVALGTSAPEIIVSLVAGLKKRRAIAVGNIIGSNTFNMLFITGTSGLFAPLIVDQIVLWLAFPALIIGTIFLWIVARDKKITSNEGAVLLGVYIFYLAGLFIL